MLVTKMSVLLSLTNRLGRGFFFRFWSIKKTVLLPAIERCHASCTEGSLSGQYTSESILCFSVKHEKCEVICAKKKKRNVC